MPKETVRPVGERQPFAAEVVWEADAWMQLGIRISDEDPERGLASQLYDDQGMRLAQIGQQMRDLVHDEDKAHCGDNGVTLGRLLLEYLDHTYGMRTVRLSLDRQSCNRLVQVLRRARNQVFGADE